MTEEQKLKFEGEVKTAILPAMGNEKTIIEAVANVLSGYYKEVGNIGWTKSGNVMEITHQWGKVQITNHVQCNFIWNA